MEGRFALIPHVATQVAAEARPPAAGASRLALTYDVEVQAGGPVSPRVPLSAELRGPGDVLSIDRAMIARVEPEPGLRGFETNYFPFIEFRDADFPWRFSLDLLPGDRRRPWIALIALKADEFAFLEPGGPAPAHPRARQRGVLAGPRAVLGLRARRGRLATARGHARLRAAGRSRA